MARPPERPERESTGWVYGLRPVEELVLSRPAEVERLFVARAKGGGLGEILRRARQWGIPISQVTPELLSRRVSGRHQGIAAQVSAVGYVPVEELCRSARAPDALLLLVDRVTDPGNLGAILRTAAAAGVAGVILSTSGTAGLGPVVAKSSAGVVERIPVAREPHPARRLEALHRGGFGSLLLDPRGETAWDELRPSGPLVIVVGGEEQGPSASLRQICHKHVAIPLARGVESLNVAISTGVLLFEVVRQYRNQRGGP